jgi:hypothetical protein
MIPVPDLPIGAMRDRARITSMRDRLRTFAAGAAICFVALGAGAGGKIYQRAYVWFSKGQTSTLRHSFVEVREPTVADVRDIVRRAAFTVVFPAGIPSGTRLTSLLYYPHDHPNFVQVQYSNEIRGLDFGVSLYGAGAINADSPVPASEVYKEDVYRWQTDAEYIVIPKAQIPAREAARIEAATVKASPTTTLLATEKMLRTIEDLSGDPKIADIAEHYAPTSGTSVLLGPVQLRLIPKLARTDSPMFYSRRTEFGPDMRATATLNKEAVLSAGAVKGIDAVLHRGKARDSFVLFNERAAGDYLVWVIRQNGPPSSVRRYSVDKNTLLVTRSV